MALFKHKQPEAQPLKEDRTGSLDMPFLLLVFLLTLVGLLMMFSASYARANWDTGDSAYYFRRQAYFALGGLAVMLIVGRLNYFIWFRTALLILAGSILLLALVPLIGVRVNGAKRWIKIGIQFQPSDLAKLGMILAFAAMMSVWQDKMETFRYGVLPYVGIMGVIAVLLYLEPHLSATLIIGVTGATMMLLGGTKKTWLALFALAALALIFLYLKTNPYAAGRLTTALDPESDPLGDGYQGIQSRYAIGSGGFLGLGLGRSRQKYLYLPEEHNDYIFAIVCEELGFVGAVGIILLFVLLILRGYWIAIHARDRFGTLVVAGVITKLAIQVFFNVGVVSGLLPPTGISLPFFSYGGTALLLQLFEMGIVLSVSRWCVNKDAVGRSQA